MSTDRELVAETVVDAPPERVWAVLTDFRNLAAASPELVAMKPLKAGGLRVGQWYVGLNRRGAVLWPTRNVVVDVEPLRRLAWDTRSSGARWVFELVPVGTSTRLVQRRPVPRRLTPVGRVFATAFLGGGKSHADELEAGMAATIDHLRRAAEA